MALVCLMTMVSANAQYSKGVRNMKRMEHNFNMFRIQQNARYAASKGNYYYGEKERKPQVATGDGVYDVPLTSSEHKDPTSWMKHFVLFGGGIGYGNIKPTNGISHESFDLEFIAMNVLFCAKFGNLVDTQGYDFGDANSLQVGILIPIITFDKTEYLWGQRGKIFIAPVIGFISADETHVDGEFMHENTYYHHCTWWIDESYKKDADGMEYGGAVMVKYGCGYVLGKVTDKSWGVSIGLCF